MRQFPNRAGRLRPHPLGQASTASLGEAIAHAKAKRREWQAKELRELLDGYTKFVTYLRKTSAGGVKPTKCPKRSIPIYKDILVPWRRPFGTDSGQAGFPQQAAILLPYAIKYIDTEVTLNLLWHLS